MARSSTRTRLLGGLSPADPILLSYGAILLLTLLVALSPLVKSPDVISYVISFADLPLAGLTIAALLLARMRTRDSVERASWTLLAVAFGFALPVHLLGIGQTEFPTWRLDLVQELMLCGYYLMITLALELRLSGSRLGTYRGVRVVRMAGTAVFVIGLFIYYVALPGFLDREIYDSWVPSFFLYVVLDLHIVVRIIGLLATSKPGPWRETYWFILASFGIWMGLDFLELSHYVGEIVFPFGSAADIIWCFPYLPLLIAARRRTLSRTEEDDEPERTSQVARIPFLITQPLFYAVVVPILHFGSYALDWSDLLLRDERELVMLVMLPLLAGLSFLHHRALEKENERLESEREEVARRIQRSRRMESIGRLAGGIAHDFNNLLQVIHGSNEVLRNRIEPTRPEYRHLEDIQESVERAARLTDQLLAVGRRKHMDPKPVSLNEVVLRTVGIIDRVIGEHIRVQVTTNPNAGHVCVDRSQLDQALLNLAINARDAMPDGGSLSIETESMPRSAEDRGSEEGDSPARWAVIRMRDTGCGMDAEVQAKVFEPFFTTKVEGEGTGLGLSMVYGFVTQSGGRVHVESEPGLGTQISLWFPGAEGRVEET
ncbi:MAG TPA: hypothetical protein ENJ09_02340, partial [Planctomycetes bacterium]|nr:hypothetical protein [Planctomycetota bacterium]